MTKTKVKAIGLKNKGFERLLPFFRIGATFEHLQDAGKFSRRIRFIKYAAIPGSVYV